MSILQRFRICVLQVAICLLLSPCHLVTLSPCHAVEDILDSPMYKTPDLPFPSVVTVYPEGLTALWLRALERPEAEMRCKAADAIALAQRRGMKGLETTVAPLLAALERPDQHPTVRLAVARALVVLEARSAAPSLLQQAQTGSSDLRDVVEPALARWDYQPARAVWLERLREPATPQRNLVLAIRGLAVVGEGQAAGRLRDMVLSDDTSKPLRLEAARALATLRADGLEKDAEHLATDTSARGLPLRLDAATLLHRHRSAEAVRLLQRLAKDPEPAVAAVAVAPLIEIDPALAVPALDDLLASPDANLRSFGVEILRRQPTEQRIHLLGDRLEDAYPDVRIKARRSLHELAEKRELRDSIIAEGTKMLGTQQWRGVEQAAILLTQLDHKPAARRLVDLLLFDRPEVCVTAAWALRRLAVPETLPPVASFVDARYPRAKELPKHPDIPAKLMDFQLSQLNQFLGQQRYGKADALLQRFIPNDPNMPESRAAAVWALGLIHEGKRMPALAAALEVRLNDTTSIPPECAQVRSMAALTLGRLGAKEALPSLRKQYPAREPAQNPVNNAAGWAIEQLTGEAMPPPRTFQRVERDWFLTPDR